MNTNTQHIWKSFWETVSKSPDPLSALDMAEVSQRNYLAMCNRVQGLLQLCKDDVVLNIGCGNGLFEEQVATTVKKITSLDFSQTLLEKAQARNASSANVAFLQASATALPFANAQFSKILCYSMVHYLSPGDLDALLEECKRVAQPGALVLIGDISTEEESTAPTFAGRLRQMWRTLGWPGLIQKGAQRLQEESRRRIQRWRRHQRKQAGVAFDINLPQPLFRVSRDRLLSIVTTRGLTGEIVEQTTERFYPGRYHLLLRISSCHA